MTRRPGNDRLPGARWRRFWFARAGRACLPGPFPVHRTHLRLGPRSSLDVNGIQDSRGRRGERRASLGRGGHRRRGARELLGTNVKKQAFTLEIAGTRLTIPTKTTSLRASALGGRAPGKPASFLGWIRSANRIRFVHRICTVQRIRVNGWGAFLPRWSSAREKECRGVGIPWASGLRASFSVSRGSGRRTGYTEGARFEFRGLGLL